MYEISIIVPVYNNENYLEKCIESILSQTLDNFELILVDDGSTDNSGAICDEFAKSDSRIVVIHKRNGGVSSARNAGIDIARGEFLMFCDADDFVSTEWCMQLYQTAKKNPNSWIISNIAKINFNNVCSINPHHRLNKFTLTYFDIFAEGLSAYTVNKIFCKKTINNNNIRFDEASSMGEDVMFNLQYYVLCKKIIYLPDVLYYYCENPNSAMHKYSNDVFMINAKLFKARLSLISNEELSEYCNIYLYMFLQWLNKTFAPNNRMSFLQKMRYNHKMMNTDEFKYCIKNASGQNNSPLFMKVVRTHNYYLFWAFTKITNLKQKLFARKKVK